MRSVRGTPMDEDELIELGADLCEKCDNRQKLLLARSLLLSISKSGSDEVASKTLVAYEFLRMDL
jgi:hypothetical protein